MKITCLGYDKMEFKLDPPEAGIVKIITFVCPE